ncbi:MAG: pyridoxal-phosphate dependent enzyme [Desulfatiglandales bacterium]
MIALFEQYPLLQNKLPYTSLGQFPTPVQKLERLGRDLHMSHLYIKRDDLSGKVYGGNKPRKLEFLLGKALRANTKEVITFGAAGSNHALATAIYAQQIGLKSISMLLPQPNAHYVRRNLLMSHHCGAELHLCRAALHSWRNWLLLFWATTYQLLRHKLRSGCFPQLIPPGGSSPLGVIGFVNAAFELKEQIVNEEMPEPDYIYVASGTMGTAAGLMLGLRAANLRSQVISVRVADDKFMNAKGMIKLIYKTNLLLHSLDASFPKIKLSAEDLNIRHDFYGQEYALFTRIGMEAVARMKEREGINLEGTYTGKTLAAVVTDSENADLRDKVVLFWNTLNSSDFSAVIAGVDYHSLPRSFHQYFEQEVQPLDVGP